jgi:hypothetical protein
VRVIRSYFEKALLRRDMAVTIQYIYAVVPFLPAQICTLDRLQQSLFIQTEVDAHYVSGH